VPLRGHTSSVYSVAFSPNDNKLASGSEDWTIRFWDADTGESVGVPLQGHTDSVHSVAFLHDGKMLASGSYDHTIRFWNAPKEWSQEDAIRNRALPCKMPQFNDGTKMEDDGWIMGPNDELLFWVPPIYRAGLHRPSTIVVLGAHATRLSVSDWNLGLNWTRCYKI
jgi:WD40 repeat protein